MKFDDVVDVAEITQHVRDHENPSSSVTPAEQLVAENHVRVLIETLVRLIEQDQSGLSSSASTTLSFC